MPLARVKCLAQVKIDLVVERDGPELEATACHGSQPMLMIML